MNPKTKKNSPYKSGHLSSNLLKLAIINSKKNLKKNKDIECCKNCTENEFNESNFKKAKKFAESVKHKAINMPLIQFMENQNRKKLSTKFSDKDAEKFLNEKDKAMEEIIIDENILMDNTDNNNCTNITNNNSNHNNKSKHNNKSNHHDDKTSKLLVFRGTFGEDKIGEFIKQEQIKNHLHRHRHHNHHHHHRHHRRHYHSCENVIMAIKSNKDENSVANKN